MITLNNESLAWDPLKIWLQAWTSYSGSCSPRCHRMIWGALKKLLTGWSQICDHFSRSRKKPKTDSRVLGSVNLRSFKADKRIEFLLPTKLEKNRPSKGFIFRACSSTGTSLKLHISHLALPVTGTSRNWDFPQLGTQLGLFFLFYLELESLNFILFLFFLLLQIYEMQF